MEQQFTGASLSDIQDYGFLIFLFCFFIFVYQLSSRRKMISDMMKSLFRGGPHYSIFKESVGNETLDKVLFCLQSMLLISTIILSIASQVLDIELTTIRMFRYILLVFSALIAFGIFKFLSVMFTGHVFFSREQGKQFNEDFVSIISLIGVAIFVPALFMFYIKDLYYFGMIMVLITLSIAFFVAMWRLYRVFFSHNTLLFYFILYLCTLEIVPLYLLYKIIECIFNVA
ncbi:MAG: DUF4271 domain-containing protein [Dysgonamonadaceae bacterium]|nr:DUF4271 domain-containing protein [Dysgonamonadaceae bacterium]